MKTYSSLKTLVFASALLLAVGALSSVVAQEGDVTFQTTVGSDPLISISPVTIVPFAPVRTYSGAATQTTAAGATSTGTFTLSYFKGGGVAATTTFGGVSATYNGYLAQPASGAKGQRSGSIYSYTLVDASSSTGAKTFTVTDIPLIVNKSVAYGGIQNEDGSTLTFRGARQAK